MRTFKRLVRRFLRSRGYELIPSTAYKQGMALPVELDASDARLIEVIIQQSLTMVSPIRLATTLKACRYVVESGLEGDFVECGVWRGGNGILAKAVFESLKSEKQVYMFDTFTGMTAPEERDFDLWSGESALSTFLSNDRGEHNEWCYASLEEVRQNCAQWGLDLKGIKFIKGDVLTTLNNPINKPKCISILRLDTDWYSSTKKELEELFPILVSGGILLIDDYGHWKGARQAVDEYFRNHNISQLLIRVDYTCRVMIKPM